MVFLYEIVNEVLRDILKEVIWRKGIWDEIYPTY